MISSVEPEKSGMYKEEWHKKSEEKFQELIIISIVVALITYTGGTLLYSYILDVILPLELVFRLLPVFSMSVWFWLYKRNLVRAFSFGHLCYQSLFFSHALLTAYVFPGFIITNIITCIPIILVPALFLTWSARQTLINIVLGLGLWLGIVFFWNMGSPEMAYFLTTNLMLVPIGLGTYFYSDYKYQFGLKLFTAYSEIEKVNFDLKLKNETIESQVVMLDESLRAQDKILSIISHDLKSPLATLNQLSQIAKDEQYDLTKEEFSEILEQILITSANMSTVLDGLLNWTLARNKKMYLKKEKLNATEEILEVIELFQSNARQKDIEINFINKSNLFLKADKRAFQVIVRNFVSNALKFTNSGGVITIDLRKISDHVEVIVEDNGVGISDDKLGRIFNNPESTFGTDNEIGTGLGLALCREIIELNDGEISVESEMDKGSRFKVILPSADE